MALLHRPRYCSENMGDTEWCGLKYANRSSRCAFANLLDKLVYTHMLIFTTLFICSGSLIWLNRSALNGRRLTLSKLYIGIFKYCRWEIGSRKTHIECYGCCAFLISPHSKFQSKCNVFITYYLYLPCQPCKGTRIYFCNDCNFQFLDPVITWL